MIILLSFCFLFSISDHPITRTPLDVQCRSCSYQSNVKGWYTCWRIQRGRSHKRLDTLHKIVLRATKVRCCISCDRDLLSGHMSQQLFVPTCSLRHKKRCCSTGNLLRSSQFSATTTNIKYKLQYTHGLLGSARKKGKRQTFTKNLLVSSLSTVEQPAGGQSTQLSTTKQNKQTTTATTTASHQPKKQIVCK